MAAKKKTRRKSTKSNRAARKKATPTKTAKRPKKVAQKKLAAKSPAKKTSGKKQTRKRSQRRGALSFSAQGPGSRSGKQSGDLQGLSRVEAADSESVDELLEEGNAFEADVVAGVESAEDADEEEVHTHEVPEDDVPAEYLDEE